VFNATYLLNTHHLQYSKLSNSGLIDYYSRYTCIECSTVSTEPVSLDTMYVFDRSYHSV
jgi:hypothetical protein